MIERVENSYDRRRMIECVENSWKYLEKERVTIAYI